MKMKRRNFLTLCLASAGAKCYSFSKGCAGRNPLVEEELRRQIDTKLIYGGVCGMVGGPLYVDGLQWFRKQPKPMVEDSIFDLASVGKTFTSFLCAKLVGEGKMDPDAPFTKYLPQHILAREDCKITVRDLAMHIGGFNNDKPYIVWNDPKEFDRRLFLKRPVWARGVKHCYACSNFIYLGRIVENLTGMDLEAAAKKFIWDPLGMKDTTWSNIPNHPRAVETFANGNVPIGMRGDGQARAYPRGQGNGAAFSTAADMLRFVDAILNRRLLNKEAYDLLYTCSYEKGEERYSFGWGMEPARVPPGWSNRTIFHGGFTGNTIAIDPENGFAGVVLTNRRGERMAGYMGHARLLSLMSKG